MATNQVQVEQVQTESADLLEDQLDRLKDLFPQAFNEGKVDFDKLRATLGDHVDDRPERYTFTWAGKRDAIRLLQTPTRATLVPCREESVNFDDTQHIFIEGDNLEVLKLLYKPYFGRVKMIYIDPPYNTGNDFIYPDNFADPLATYLQITGQQDAEGNLLTSNPETSGRYHSAWLTMMYPRLFLARQLLREDGIIFVSIDDNELHNLRLLTNEIFGEENSVATIIWQKNYAPKSSARHFSADHDFILAFARDASHWLPELLPRTKEQDSVYKNPDNDPRGRWRPNNLAARNPYSKGLYSITCPGGRVIPGPPKGSYWRIAEEKLWRLHADGRIWWGEDGNNVPAPKIFLSEVKQGRVPQTLWFYKDVGHNQEAKKDLLKIVHFEDTENVLDTVKPARLIRRMLQIATTADDSDIVLDFFAGSATTAHAVLAQNLEDGGNRRYIMVQLPEPLPQPETALHTIADIGKQRIRCVAAQMRQESAGQLPLDTHNTPEDLGFRVFKLAPSNLQLWTGTQDPEPDAYAQQLTYFTDPLIEGWTPEDVIYEVAVKEGYGLNCRIESISAGHLYRVTDPDRDQSFTICLDATLDPDTIHSLNLSKDDLFICRDIALTDDLAANLALQCRLKTI